MWMPTTGLVIHYFVNQVFVLWKSFLLIVFNIFYVL